MKGLNSESLPIHLKIHHFLQSFLNKDCVPFSNLKCDEVRFKSRLHHFLMSLHAFRSDWPYLVRLIKYHDHHHDNHLLVDLNDRKF